MSTPTLTMTAELNLTLAIAKAINSPRSLAVHMLLEHGEWQQYLDLDVKPKDYQSAGNFADDYLVTKVMSKSKTLPTGIDTRQVAIDSFRESERLCAFTNDRLFSLQEFPPWWKPAKKLIARVLGPLGKPSLDKILELAAHGPGASAGVSAPRGRMTKSIKFDARPTCTPELVPYAPSIMGPTWLAYRPHVVSISGSEFFTVTKNAKTDRCCAKEPLLNLFFQKGIGRFIAHQLAAFGVDIHNQSVNQHLAAMAQALGLATLDLSMASDLITFALVFLLLPRRWYALLSLVRSRHIQMPDQQEPMLMQKFCTMGNGFTFALETLVFWAISKSVCGDVGPVNAYGDDIIVPQSHARAVVDALEFSGFRVNGKKSFLAGNFFESCGTDWFDGINVRPFFLTRSDSDSSDTLPGESVCIPYEVTMANALRIWSNRRLEGAGCDGRMRQIWEDLRNAAPHAWRSCTVPLLAGNVGFIDDAPPGALRPWMGGSGEKRYDYQCEGYRYRRIRTVPVREDRRTFGVLLSNLASAPTSDETCIDSDVATRGEEPVRGLYGLARPGWAWCDTWPDGLAWAS